MTSTGELQSPGGGALSAHNSTTHTTSEGEVFNLITTVIKTKPVSFKLFL